MVVVKIRVPKLVIFPEPQTLNPGIFSGLVFGLLEYFP